MDETIEEQRKEETGCTESSTMPLREGRNLCYLWRTWKGIGQDLDRLHGLMGI